MITSRQEKKHNPFLSVFSFTKRSLIFLTLMTSSIFFLYIAGNYQHLSDEGLQIIIKVGTVSALSQICFSITYLTASIFVIADKSRFPLKYSSNLKFVISTVLCILSALSGLFFTFLFKIIDILSMGIK